jgi:hypothetical protein
MAATLGSTGGCKGKDDGDKSPSATECAEGDTDGDGLTDCEEAELGTALHLADTDGDGFTDYYEVVELGFSPENNNFKFNPLIADTPRIRVDVSSAPLIHRDGGGLRHHFSHVRIPDRGERERVGHRLLRGVDVHHRGDVTHLQHRAV